MGFPWKIIISLRKSVGDLRPIDILTGETAVEVTGLVGANPALWYFRSSEHNFDSTQAPVVHVYYYRHFYIDSMICIVESIRISFFSFISRGDVLCYNRAKIN